MNIKTFISTEYTKENKQNKITAKHFKANALQEQAKATEELIAMLMDAHTKQMENLVKTTTEAMKEMMLLIKENKTPNVSAMDTEKKKMCNKKRKKYNKAPVCKHCGRKLSDLPSLTRKQKSVSLGAKRVSHQEVFSVALIVTRYPMTYTYEKREGKAVCLHLYLSPIFGFNTRLSTH